ncbi:MAG: efflux RND transporter periplasmic adaptor subunit [Eubacteriales bacterium]
MIKRILPIIIIIALVLTGGYYAISQLIPEDDSQGKREVIYSTSPVTRGDISVGVETSGQLNAAHGGGIRIPEPSDPKLSNISYVIEEFLAEEGDNLLKGDPVLKLASSDLDSLIDDLENQLEGKKEYLAQLLGIDISQVENINPYDGIIINAPIKGRVTELNASEGEELESLIASIVDDSEIKLSFKANKSEYTKLFEGQRVLLKFSHFDGYYEAKITKLNSNAVPDNPDDSDYGLTYVHWGEIEAENPGLVQTGMISSVNLAKSEESLEPATTLQNMAKVESYKKEKKIYKNSISSDELVVTDVLVNENDYVEKGQSLVKLAGADVRMMIQENLDQLREAQRTIDKAYELRSNLVITAPMDGVVAGFWRQKGENIKAGESVGDIFNTSNMSVYTQVDDLDVVYVKQDAPVEVTVDALTGEVFEGKVARVSQSGQDSSGVIQYSVNIEVSGRGDLRPGMMAKCFIDAGSSQDTLLLPIEAVFEEDGQSKVETLDENSEIEVVRIETGLMNDRYVEVLEGLEEGQEAITGSSSDLLPSQSIEGNDTIIPDSEEQE